MEHLEGSGHQTEHGAASDDIFQLARRYGRECGCRGYVYKTETSSASGSDLRETIIRQESHNRTSFQAFLVCKPQTTSDA